ncbi:MAG: nitronate monooxygenase, partial [Propionibacteriaceae bacterium]|nr:nitronate monooxygenase [Propionibacteriaceae bacterium]
MALETLRAGGFAYLHLGRDQAAAETALKNLARRTNQAFGIALAGNIAAIDIPWQVTRVLLPVGTDDSTIPERVERVWQVMSIADAEWAIDAGATSIAVKGNDASGRVGEESTFILFQRMITTARKQGVKVYVHGGVGVHTAAAYIALRASGVFLDSQVALLPECDAPSEVKATLGKLQGGETTLVNGYRVLKWPRMPKVSPTDFTEDYMGGLDLEKNLIPLGQDFTLATEYLNRYSRLDAVLAAIREAAYGHLRQAQFLPALASSSEMAESLGVRYPIIQGPMARVSDTPAFLHEVAEAGAMPTLAIGMSTPETTAELLASTAEVMGDLPWGAGLLGFIQPTVYEAQVEQILAMEKKPTAVVIAGGRPAQGKRLEQAGIQAFLHVPSANLLDQAIKEGARKFIFEGRESGGHIGPMYSTVLWDKQLTHLLDVEDAASLTVVFAGGIHDAVSSAFVSVMAASLAARGAKIGIIMGTAYLLTSEAVSSKAITATFQELAIEADHTMLLESAPGQETRALPTEFADVFLAEKARIEKLDLEPIAARLALEELNLGRARVASKGKDRSPDTSELIDVPAKEQAKQGLYMAGSSVALMATGTTMAGLHASVCEGAEALIAVLPQVATLKDPLVEEVPSQAGYLPSDEPIAIIGMAGVFPDAEDVDSYWRNMLMGRDSVTEVPAARWNTDVFYRPDSTDTDFVVSKWGAFLQAIQFDPIEFGIPPISVKSIEPSQLISLLVAKRALQDAGYADRIKEGMPDTSVIFGTESMGELASAYGGRSGIRGMFGILPDEIDKALPKVDEDSFPGILSNVTAGRIANRLNCGGRNFTVDAACATSLAALDVACQELWSDRTNMVICGGTDLHNSILDYIWFSGTHALSRRGYCATFDESGDGLALGEGVGAVVLKRLCDAERDHDRIYAVIRGIHGSSDGRSLGLTAPNMKGQITALKRAYQMAGVLPSEVGMVEAHGTGTAVGDRTELAALTRVMLDAGALPGQTWVGSVKTQIGHTKCAAGVAGLIRAALAVRHGVIPPTLH